MTKIIIVIILAVSIYLGIGGMGRVQYRLEYENLLKKKPDPGDTLSVRMNGITYKNLLDMKRGEKGFEMEKFNKYFWGNQNMPDLISLLLTACCFSLIGSFAQLIWQSFQANKLLPLNSVLYCATLGGLCGFFVIGLSYVIPTALVSTDDAQIRPLTLMFISLFSGFCFSKFYEKISFYFKNIFHDKKDAK